MLRFPALMDRLSRGLWRALGAACLQASLVSAMADSTVVFNELHYHPADQEARLEWVELHNQMAVNMDLSGWSLSGGIDYRFPEGTVLRGGAQLVVAADPAALRALGVTNVVGPFAGRLSNAGERLELRNNNLRRMDLIAYGTDGDWPVAPDGHGPSLAKRDETLATGPTAHWRPSAQPGGTPGQPNFPSLDIATQAPLVGGSQRWEFRTGAPEGGTAWTGTVGGASGDGGWAISSAPFFGGDASPPAGEERPIPTLFATGVSDARQPLPPGTRDPHYTVVASAQAITPPPPAPALVIEGHPAWLANDSTSRWLGPVNPGTANVAAGPYRYRTLFDLSPFVPETARLQLRVAADNRVQSVLLNGRSVGISFEGFQALSPAFAITNGFLPGTNTLEFAWANDSSSPNPAGFRAILQGTARSRFREESRLVPSLTHAACFRTAFLAAPGLTGARLRLRVTCDDGAALFLNGREIHRINLPAGPLAPDTPALAAIPGVPGPVDLVLPPGSLRAGTNVLAAQVHQAVAGAGDLWFDAELTVIEVPDPAREGLRFNEVAMPGIGFFVEVANPTSDILPLDAARIRGVGKATGTYAFPAGSVLGPGGIQAVPAALLGFRPEPGDTLLLESRDGASVLDALVLGPTARARLPDGTGPWRLPAAPSPDGTNRFRLQTEVVIHEICHHPPDPAPAGHWVELFHRGAQPVDLSGWRFAEGITYRFPAGTSLRPGEYLVVADQPEALRAAHPGIRVLGPFEGRLARGGERLSLVDADGNPADSVDYADSGRWPEEADGGGSTLELMDPMADNASPEAWAASDESARTAWVRHTYRARAVSAPGPTLWNEWVMGLLDAGECLIDDLQVIESPGTATAVQMLKNGDFETGTTSWRFLGTHRLSRVVDDPDQPGNRVLHLVATGPTEHMHNHLETTLANNRSVVNGRDYEVSFRARHLKGCPQLNTRLYFNRVARTTTLPVASVQGTPGAPNSRRVANLGPTFKGLVHHPAVPPAGRSVTVSAVVSDPDGVAEARVHWSVNGGAWQSGPAQLGDLGRLTATIPGAAAGSVVQFHLSATDGRGATTWFPARGPQSRALIGVADGRERLGTLHNLRLLMTPADRTLLHAETNVMSNEYLGGTVIHDEREIFYDVGIKLQGSQRGRLDAGRVGYTIRFPPDRLFRGVHPGISIDRSGGYTGVGGDQDEIVLKHAVQHAGGLPGMYDDLVHVMPPRTDLTGTALLILAKYGDLFLDAQFDHGSEGDLFKLELVYYPTTTVGGGREGIKRPQPDEVTGVDIGNLGNDPEVYRWFFLAENNRASIDHAQVMALGKALALSGTAQQQECERLMAVDTWLRTVAFQTLAGMVDTYPFDNPHNFMIYFRPEDGRALPFLWDMDFNFGAAATSPLNRATGNLGRLINQPVHQRRYLAHLRDLIDTTWNVRYLGPWIDHFGALAGQNFSGIRSYVEQRSAYVRSRLPAATPFRITAPAESPALVEAATAILQGTAGLEIREVFVEGPEETNRVRWINTTTWQATPPVRLGVNPLRIRGYDTSGARVVDLPWVLTGTTAASGLDTDADGLPDLWERQHGLDPARDDRSADPDGDGQSNRDEYLAGTDPRDRRSLLRLDALLEGDRLRLRWESKAGRSYVVEEHSPGESGPWRTHAEHPASPSDRPAEVSLPLPGADASQQTRLFRLRTAPPR